MRAKAGIFIIIILLLLVGTVTAVGIPDTVIITTDKPWIIANNVDQSTITITVMNSTPGLDYGVVSGVTVNLEVNNTIYGTLNPTTVTTDVSGKASSTFKAKTKSGAAQITVSGLSGSGIQNIDHDSPYYPYFSYPLTGEVNSEILFNIFVTDRWANPLDNRKEMDLSLPNHTVSLHVHGPAPDDCYFVGSGNDISPVLESHGNFSVIVNLTSKIGNNYILMDQFGSISDKVGWIVVEATGKPYSMTGTISDGGILPVDTTPFIIDYFLYDIFGNPVRNQSIWVNTTLDEQKTYTTNSLGQIQLYYGPMLTAGDITINATPFLNSSIMNTLVAHFINSGPSDMFLAVTPQTMASLDTLATQKQAFVRATVIDYFGNPVPNETVSFSLGTVSAVGFTQNISPTLSDTTAVTGQDGNAIVIFYPGSFAKRGEPGYNGTATGTVVVTAIWNGTSKSVKTTWKNYAYLNIMASAEPRNVKLNETVDITIDVVGDGYNMQGGPITAVLDQDTSASIFGGGGWKFKDTIKGAKAFVATCTEGQDYVGVTSYADTSDVINLAPTPILSLVNLSLDKLGKGNKAWLADSIIHAIHNMTETQPLRPPDKVRAVIVLEDEGGASLQDSEIAAIRAEAASTTPFTYLFVAYYDPAGGASKCTGAGNVTAAKLPNGPNQYKCLGNVNELIAAYQNFSHVLHTRAAVNASLTLDFGEIEQDGSQIDGFEAFSYVPVNDTDSRPFYDLDTTPKSRDSILGRTRIMWPNSSHSVINQFDEWNTSQKLHFNIGTVNISERWNATYRLKAVNETGLMNLFNCTMSESRLLYNDNEEPPVCLPELPIMVTNATPPANQTGLDVWNLHVTKSGNFNDYVPLEWNLKYTGFNTTTETLWYSSNSNNGSWVQFDTRTNIAPGNYINIGLLDVRNLPMGNYWIKVHAVAPDAMDDEEILGPIEVGYTGVFIKLT